MSTASYEFTTPGIITPPEILVDAGSAARTTEQMQDGFVRNTTAQICQEILSIYSPNAFPPDAFMLDLYRSTRTVIAPFINPNDFNDMPSGKAMGQLLVDLIQQSGSRVGDISRLPAQLWLHAERTTRHIQRFASGKMWQDKSYRDRFDNICESIRREQQSHIPLQQHRRKR
jgi:hypothetical protein